MTARIRPASPADADAIAATEAAAAAHPWSAHQVADTLARSTTVGWVVATGEGAVGHLLASRVADEGEILTLAVHPSHRRQGLARALLSACEAAWRDAGVRQAWLEVRASNHPARALYARHGWFDVGRRPRYYAGLEDAVCMRRDLERP